MVTMRERDELSDMKMPKKMNPDAEDNTFVRFEGEQCSRVLRT